MSNLNDRLVKGLLTRANARLDEGSGGEQWEDITDLFTVDETSSAYSLFSKFGRNDINAKGVFRIYLETYNSGPVISAYSGNARVFMFTIDFNDLNVGCIMNFSTGTITHGVDFVGTISILSEVTSGLVIAYNYEVEITEQKPKILKIERLVQ